MSFEHLLAAKPPIPYHAIAAIVAAILGAIQRPAANRRH
jgi:uncharacterized membrane protein